MAFDTGYQPHSYAPGADMAPEAIPFPFIDAEHLIVTHIADDTGVRTVLVPDADYVIAGDGPAQAGTIAATGSWPGADLFLIERSTPIVQKAVLPPGQPIPSRSVEGQLDRQAMAQQEVDARVALTLAVPYGETPPAVTLADLIEGDLLQLRDGKLQRLPRAPFAGKFYAGDGTGRLVPASGTGADAALREDLASDDAGAALVAYDGMTAQDALDRAIYNLGRYGSLSTPAGVAAAVAAAKSSVAPSCLIQVAAPLSLGTAPVYPSGQDIIGAPLYWNAGGGLGRQLVNLWGRERQTHFGTEYLFRLHYILEQGLPVKIALIGDSNTASYAGPILQALLDLLPGSTVQNFAVGSTYEAEWFGETGVFATGQPYEGSNYSAVKAFAPDLLINGYGFTNDPYFGRTVEQAIATKRAFLTDYRNAGGVRGAVSILQLSANSQRDGANGRDEYALAEYNARLRSLCDERAFEVAFFDKTAVTPNAAVDVGVGGMENRHIDAAGVHTTFAHSRILAHAIYEFLIPGPYRTGSAGAPLEVTPGTGFTQPALTTPSERMLTVPTGGPGITAKGYLAMTAPATLTAGQAIGTVGAGHRPATPIYGVDLEIYNSAETPTFQTIKGAIAANGTITTRTASTYAAERVYLEESWVTT